MFISLLNTKVLKHVRTLIKDKMKKNHIPGVAVALVDRKELVLCEALGACNINTQVPLTLQTRFCIGSTHQAITSMLMATFVEEGLLDWDMLVIDVYPDFELYDLDATEEILVQDLLYMSSGIPRDAENELDQRATPEDIFEYVADLDLSGWPGENFNYSHISTALGAYIGVMAADGMYGYLYEEYSHLLEKRILKPIGMSNATLLTHKSRPNEDYAFPHKLKGKHVVVAKSRDIEGNPLAPANGLKASILDMAHFIQTQINRGIAPNGQQVVSEEHLIETWKPNEQVGNGDYGMGWITHSFHGITTIYCNSRADHFASLLGFMPDYDIGFVLLANSEHVGDLLEEMPLRLAKMLDVE